MSSFSPPQGYQANPLILHEVSIAGAATLDTGEILTKDVLGRTELFYEEDDGTQIQLTSSGKINVAAVGIGLADQIIGTNHTATGIEYKTLTAGSGISITHAAGAVTFASTLVTDYFYLPGRAGGQIGYGSNLASQSLTLSATSHGTAGAIYFCNTATTATMTLLSTGTLLINAAAAISTEKLSVVGDIRLGSDSDILPFGDGNSEIGTDALRWGRIRAVTVVTGDLVTGDLVLKSSDGSAHWLIKEESDRVVFENRITGKRFRAVLEEVAA